MIATPRRSVTRFFIPLIDVLILLFCIFLLMPFVSGPANPDDDGKPEAKAEPPPKLPADVAELQRRLAEANARLERFQQTRAQLADRLSMRVLEIDKDKGTLHYYESGRQEVRTAADAQRLIDRQRRLAGDKDVFFTILYPREVTGFPTGDQIKTYREWFKDVPHGFDIPTP